MTNRRSIPAASAAGARGRAHHTLAPDHLGEATAAAVVAVVVGGIAMVITGIGMVALALTTGARYGGSPPPDVASLAIGPVLGGLGLIALGGALTAGAIAVLGGARRARPVTGVLAALTAGLAALGTVLAATSEPTDVVISIALTVATLIFGVAAILLLRPRR